MRNGASDVAENEKYVIKIQWGDTQHIVWSMRSSDVKKLCLTRKKTSNLVLFIFSSDSQKKQKNSVFKTCINPMEFLCFPYGKKNFQAFFIFSSDLSQNEEKRPLLELVDQTVYWVWPKSESRVWISDHSDQSKCSNLYKKDIVFHQYCFLGDCLLSSSFTSMIITIVRQGKRVEKWWQISQLLSK